MQLSYVALAADLDFTRGYGFVADQKVALLGAMQALFEASMYTFVFLWTPALSPKGEQLPHGFIFATFMTASMVGTAMAGRLMVTHRLEDFMQVRRACNHLAKAALSESSLGVVRTWVEPGEENGAGV
jgi:hypothetical protein